MKALVYTGTQRVEYRDEADPQPDGEAEVLVAVDACGLCGSDMHAYHGKDERRVPPLILGHEAVGTVSSGPRSGERVILNPLITCMNCTHCQSGNTNLCERRELIGMRMPGAFAEQVVIAASNLIPMPAGMDLADASLAEPTAVSLHALRLAERCLSRPISELRAVVLGAGAIGAIGALLLQLKGCRDIHVADTNPLRRSTARQHGWGEVYNPVETEPQGGTFDLVLDAVGSGQTRAAASRLVRSGGVICHAGLQDDEAGLDTRRLTLQEVLLIGCYTYTRADLDAAVAALDGGHLGGLEWIERRSLADGASAFADVHNGSTGSPKIVLFAR